MTDKDLILVTGATGFVGKWVVIKLLQAGYAVRGTIRSMAKAPQVLASVTEQVGREAASRLELVEALLRKGADLQRPGSVKPAVLARILKNQDVSRLLVAKGAEPPLPALPARPAAARAASSGSVASGPAVPPAAEADDGDDALPAYTPRTTGL